MNNDEFQNLVLKQLTELSKGQRELQQPVTRMESTMSDKFGGLFDAREVQFDVNQRILASLERIESKVGKHDIQISVLDRVKSNRRKMK